MKFFILLLFALPQTAFAHCPMELNVDGKSYCSEITWLDGDKKVQGKLEPTTELSPQLVLMGEIPQKWVYSRAEFSFWEKGDASHTPQIIDNLRIFPYMHMETGHHHSTSYEYAWLNETAEISAVALQEMRGCWSFRWTKENHDTLEDSEFLMNIEGYNNLSDEKNSEMSDFCTSVGSGGGHGGHHHNH